MPGHSAGRISGRPSLLACLRTACARANRIEDRFSVCRNAGSIVSLGSAELEAQLGRVRRLRVDDVIGDLVAIATSAPRSFAQLRRGFRDHLVKDLPRSCQQSADAFRLSGRERFGIARCGYAGRTEIGGRVARDALYDLELHGGWKSEARGFGDDCVSRQVSEERLDRQLLLLTRTRPPRP